MHELKLTEQIIRLAEDAARREGAARVTRINLIVGEDSSVVADCVALYFDLISKDTLCAQAALSFERVKPRLRCQRCGQLFERKPFRFDCPCGGEGLPTEIGREFFVKSIEIEEIEHGEGN